MPDNPFSWIEEIKPSDLGTGPTGTTTIAPPEPPPELEEATPAEPSYKDVSSGIDWIDSIKPENPENIQQQDALRESIQAFAEKSAWKDQTPKFDDFLKNAQLDPNQLPGNLDYDGAKKVFDESKEKYFEPVGPKDQKQTPRYQYVRDAVDQFTSTPGKVHKAAASFMLEDSHDPETKKMFMDQLEKRWKFMGPIGPNEAGAKSGPLRMVPFSGTIVSAGELFDAKKKFEALQAHQNGDIELSPADLDLYRNELFARVMAAKEMQIRDTTGWAQVKEGVKDFVPFALEFMLTGGLAAVGKKAAVTAGKAALKGAVEKGVGTLGRGLLKSGIKASALAAGAATRLPGLAGRVLEGSAQRQLPQFEITPKGEAVLLKKGESAGIATLKAIGDTYIEALSEESGAAIGKGIAKAGGLLNRGAKYTPTFQKGWEKVRGALAKAWASDKGKTFKEGLEAIATKAGYHGMLEEMGEERVGDVLRAITGVQDFGLEGDQNTVINRLIASVPDSKQLLVEAGIFAVPGVTKAGLGGVVSVNDMLSKRETAEEYVRNNPEAVRRIAELDSPPTRKQLKDAGITGQSNAEERLKMREVIRDVMGTEGLMEADGPLGALPEPAARPTEAELAERYNLLNRPQGVPERKESLVTPPPAKAPATKAELEDRKKAFSEMRLERDREANLQDLEKGKRIDAEIATLDPLLEGKSAEVQDDVRRIVGKHVSTEAMESYDAENIAEGVRKVRVDLGIESPAGFDKKRERNRLMEIGKKYGVKNLKGASLPKIQQKLRDFWDVKAQSAPAVVQEQAPVKIPRSKRPAPQKTFKRKEKAPSGPAPLTEADLAKMTPHQIIDRVPASNKPAAQMTRVEAAAELYRSQIEGMPLPNKRAYKEAQKSRPKAIVAHLDGDALKWVNDNVAHEAGDKMLRAIGTVLRKRGIEAYHVSGDEFNALGDNAQELAKNIDAALQELQNKKLSYTLPDGTEVTHEGAGFSYGVAENDAAAEEGLKAHKAQREKEGVRPERGAKPAGISGLPASGRQVQDSEPGRDSAGGLKSAESVKPAPVKDKAPEPVKQEAKPAEKAAPAKPSDALYHSDYEVIRAPVDKINVDAKRFQYKLSTDEAGVRDALEGPWDDRVSGIVLLWEAKDGKLFVVNGHHRIELARREGVKDIRATLVREKDGITPEAARLRGAIENIKSGRGSIADTAEMWRLTSEEDLEETEKEYKGNPKNTTGYRIGRFASDETYNLWRSGKIGDRQAAALSTAAPGNELDQHSAVGYVQEEPEATAADIKRYIAAGKALQTQPDWIQGGLFEGDEDFIAQEENRKAINKLVSKKINAIKDKLRTIRSASKVDQSKAAAEYGIKVKSDSDLTSLEQALQKDIERLETYWHSPEVIKELQKELDNGNLYAQQEEKNKDVDEGAEGPGVPPIESGAKTTETMGFGGGGPVASNIVELNTNSMLKDVIAPIVGWARKNLTAKGNLPENAFELKIRRDGRIKSAFTKLQGRLKEFRTAAKKAYGKKKLDAATLQNLNQALKDPARIDMVPDAMRPIIFQMRSDIDQLSMRLIESGAIQGPMAETITENLGVYLNRSYQVFQDPKWASKVPPEVVNRATSFIRASLTEDGVLPAEEEVQGVVHRLLHPQEDSPLSFVQSGKLGSKDLSILQRRKGIPAEIRALWGENTSALANYAMSVGKMSQLLENHKFLTELRSDGIESYFYERPWMSDDAYTVKIASEGSKAYSPLNGLYTTKEIAEAIENFDSHESVPDWLRWYMRVNGAVKFSKTVGSVMTQVRNLMGNTGFAVAQGHWKVWNAKDAFKATAANLMKSDKDGWLDFYRRMQELGVVHESVRAGELRDVLEDAASGGLTLEDLAIGREAGLIRKGLGAITATYQAEDDIWKVYAWKNEVDRYSKARPDWSIEKVERHAAKVVRNTYPTYSHVPNSIKMLRRFPLVGTFVSFPAEVIRVAKNTVMQIKEDLSDPATRGIGAQRLVGTIIAAGTTKAITDAVMFMLGMGPDEDKDIRRFVAPWNKNSDLMYTEQPQNGKAKFIDLSYSDPWSYLKKPIAALLSGKNINESVIDAFKEAAEPFFSEDVLAQYLIDAARNKKGTTGGRVYNPQDSGTKIATDVSKHIWNALEPGTISSLMRIWKGVTGEVSPYGKEYDAKTELYAMALGMRNTDLDVEQAMQFKARAYMRGVQDSSAIARKVLGSKGTVTPKEVEAAYKSTENSRQELFRELSDDILAAKRLGVAEDNIREALKSGGIGRGSIEALFEQKYSSFIPSAALQQKRLEDAMGKLPGLQEAKKKGLRSKARILSRSIPTDPERREKYREDIRKAKQWIADRGVSEQEVIREWRQYLLEEAKKTSTGKVNVKSFRRLQRSLGE